MCHPQLVRPFRLRASVLAAVLAAAGVAVGLLTAAPPAAAQRDDPSALSALSLLPVAVVLAAPALLLSGGVSLTVVAVQASATGTVWVLERSADGARMTLALACGAGVAGLIAGTTAGSMAVGSALVVTALSTGWLISTASEAVAFVPNEAGAALRYNERVSR